MSALDGLTYVGLDRQ